MQERAFRNIGSTLSGIATHTATAAITTGTFSYTPEALRDLVTRWTSLAESYQQSRENAQAMTQVKGPGLEYASQAHASVANSSGQAYLLSVEQKWRYCLAQAQKFQNALDDYLGVEHRNIETMDSAGPRDGI
jgi:hypothetical protein